MLPKHTNSTRIGFSAVGMRRADIEVGLVERLAQKTSGDTRAAAYLSQVPLLRAAYADHRTTEADGSRSTVSRVEAA